MLTHTKLPQPYLLDFTKISKNDLVEISIENTLHKFSKDADYSGSNIRYQPIFGSTVYIDGVLYSKSTYGLPFIKFAKNSEPKITWINNTLFTFNIHYHGLNTVGSVDGTSMETVFGHSTKLGPKVKFQFPKITNNQSMLWFHNHNMFVSMELIYSGAIGLLQIVDEETKWLSKRFEYGNNHLMMIASDIDLTDEGTQTNLNLTVDQNRSAFTTINGITAINWYSKKESPYVTMLYHETTDDLVKIDILNACLNWRVYHIGVCDEDRNIRSFHLIQSDSGLINPQKLKMTFIPVAGRISILVNLSKFKNNTAYVFFYDYDLTEIFDSSIANPSNPSNPSLLGTIPNFEKKNQSVYPTPIPDPPEPNEPVENQQDNPTNLNYPRIKINKQINQVLQNGTIVKPKLFNIKQFLKITQVHDLDKKKTSKYFDVNIDNELESNCNGNYYNDINYHDDMNSLNSIGPIDYTNSTNSTNSCTNLMDKLLLDDILVLIKKTVFGLENYEKHIKLLSEPNFEYINGVDYINMLNPNYFYNLPKLNSEVPNRNFLLFPESNINSIASGNPNGVTEYIDSANRIMVDLWNSTELNLEYAINQYNLSPNNFKPKILPTSKFKIYETNDKYSNTAMISNDTITIEFFDHPIAYGDNTSVPITRSTVIFPPSDYINIQEWIDLVNSTFKSVKVSKLPGYKKLSEILQSDWSFFPYKFVYMGNKTIWIKSAIIKTTNNSPYYIRILGRWPILQFFGKSLTGATLSSLSENVPGSVSDGTRNIYHMDIVKNNSQFIKCDEYGIYGIYDADVQALFPAYATSDGLVQLPIACMKRNGELIVSQNSTFKGFYDGYLNDNLSSFSVRLKTTELWVYNNGDGTDAHPIHFHLTSGFALPISQYNSPNLLSPSRASNPLIYSRDIYQVGPQETIGFYLTWPNYPSDAETSEPNIVGAGGVVHCHFLSHNDSNSMIIKYYVNP